MVVLSVNKTMNDIFTGRSHYAVADETIRCCNCSWRVQNFGSIADHVVECFVNIPKLKTHVVDRINPKAAPQPWVAQLPLSGWLLAVLWDIMKVISPDFRSQAGKEGYTKSIFV